MTEQDNQNNEVSAVQEGIEARAKHIVNFIDAMANALEEDSGYFHSPEQRLKLISEALKIEGYVVLAQAIMDEIRILLGDSITSTFIENMMPTDENTPMQ